MLKRICDVVIAIIMLVLTAPVLVVLSLLVAIKLGRPVVFTQVRPGRNENPFTIYKFRTMSDLIDPLGNSLPDDQRLGSFGEFLRATSLDELPELWNVLKGDMSVVGPRPLLMEYIPLYNDIQRRRQEVRPGITGWAQINGRNAISWKEKLELDVWYVDNQSIWLDIKILLLTAKKVLAKEGISANDHVTMEKFTGND